MPPALKSFAKSFPYSCRIRNPEFLPAMRVIDANINRLRDALRVIEDTLRFVKSDPLWKKIRTLRTRVAKIFTSGRKNYPLLLVSRDSSSDKGRNSKQNRHKNILSILRANFARSSESLRVLEEYSRLVMPDKVLLVKKIRFELYETERKVWIK